MPQKLVPYPRRRGPMGGAPYIGPRWGMGRYSRYPKERPGKLPMLAIYSFIIWIVAAATVDFSLIQAGLPIQSKGGRDTSPSAAVLSGHGYDR